MFANRLVTWKQWFKLLLQFFFFFCKQLACLPKFDKFFRLVQPICRKLKVSQVSQLKIDEKRPTLTNRCNIEVSHRYILYSIVYGYNIEVNQRLNSVLYSLWFNKEKKIIVCNLQSGCKNEKKCINIKTRIVQ